MESFKVSAPVRADLAGGTLDIWPLYCLVDRDPKTINVALELRTSVTFERLQSGTFRLEIAEVGGTSESLSSPVDMTSVSKVHEDLRFPSILASQFWSDLKEFCPTGLRLKLETSCPRGSGLGGSSTLAVAMVRGFCRLMNAYVNQGWQWELMPILRDAEAKFLKVPTGVQDYLSAMFGGFASYTFSSGKIDREAYDDSTFAGLQDRALVIFSGASHHSGLSNWEVYKRVLEGDSVFLSGINNLAKVATDIDEKLRSPHLQWKEIGEQLSHEWSIRRELFKADVPKLDELMTFLSSKKEVLGAKVCGAAQGGSVLAIVEPSARGEIAKTLEQKGMRVLSSSLSRNGVVISEVKPKKDA